MKWFAYVLIVLIGLYGVYGLEVSSPQEKSYYMNDIEFKVNSNVTFDNISYVLDGNYTFACSNCSSYTENKTLLPGNHSLNVTGIIGNLTESKSVFFEIKDIDLNIISPLHTSYYDEILLKITTGVNASLSYSLNNKNYTACSNCALFESQLDLDEGQYNLMVTATKDNVTQQKLTSFMVVSKPHIDLEIISPKSKSYYSGNISLIITTNANATISYSLNNENFSGCTNCNRFEKLLTLQNGTYKLVARADFSNVSEQKIVNFRVSAPKNESKYKFDKGFQDLPKLLENGKITDAEPAEIIRNNRINPGIINRLIKSKKLGPESIDAILETQFNPAGIFRKLLFYFGIHEKGFAELIAEYYKLDDKMNHKLLTRDDIREDFAHKIESALELHRRNDTVNITPEENNSFVAGNMHGKGIVKSKELKEKNREESEKNSNNEKNREANKDKKENKDSKSSMQEDYKETGNTNNGKKNGITGNSFKSGNNGHGNSQNGNKGKNKD